jgi:predicted transcriptional regulator
MFKALWNRAWRDGGDPLRVALGNLEREVMDTVWQVGNGTVKDVQGRLPRAVAYTTVMTTLDRLFKKGYVNRERVGRAFVYRAVRSREQTQAALASGIMSGLFSGNSAMPLLSNLVDAVGSQDGAADLLDALEQMVREKRRRLEQDDALPARERGNRKP